MCNAMSKPKTTSVCSCQSACKCSTKVITHISANEFDCQQISHEPVRINLRPTAVEDWTPLQALLIGWPQRIDTWRERAAPAQAAIARFATLVVSLTKSVAVHIAVNESTADETPHILLGRLRQQYGEKRVNVLRGPMDDCWVRDTGPIFTTAARSLTCARFLFNAWGGENGGCYSDYANDLRFGARVSETFGIISRSVPMVLEGGSICSDGQGTLLTTEECLLNINRNPHLTREAVEKFLGEHLGARKVLWLSYGAAFDDDTDGHIDNMAAFASPGHVLLAWADEHECPEQHRRSKAALDVLQTATDACGRRLTVHLLPTPIVTRTQAEAVGVQDGAKARVSGRVCASYVNFVLVEDVVFVPAFGVEEDRIAENVLRNVFEGRRVIRVDAREFVLAGGGLHCLTLGVPRVAGCSTH